RLLGVTRANPTGTGFTYDAVNRLTSMTQDFAGTGNDITWSFSGRNPANQITKWDASSTVYDYKEAASATTNKTYDGLNRDAGIAALSGGYDARGNMTFDGVRTMTYDLENRLKTVSAPGISLQLDYDPEGRLSKLTSSGAVTSFLYDGVNLIGEYDGAGNMTKRYMHTLGTDQPWVEFSGSAVGLSNATYLYANYQGSIIATADGSGNLTNLYKYGPYGEPKDGNNVDSWSGERFRYTGQIMIPEAKLYYYKARVYDPIAGRFLQTDPVGSKDDLDLYAYVKGDPVNQVDPDGQQTVPLGQTGMSDRNYLSIMGGFKAIGDYIASHPGQTIELIGNIVQGAGVLTVDPALAGLGNKTAAVGNFVKNTSGELGTAVPVTPTNTNPYKGPIDQPVVVVDKNSNAIPVKTGEQIKGSPNGDYQQVVGPGGPTGTRMDRGGHKNQSDPAAQQPHGHVDKVTQPDGNPHLPIY
ncbi:RHS repeat-associated core domain-containing protein, partial [Asticcacaulis sp. 201]|uniref:RHS repeat-associated core domain-containing protein n=1 Tax=Asticcacaulis sp. 201 TaxID=3028787 RepID=UPI0029165FD1